MSTTDTGPVKASLGFWPKLVLWSLVLVFGVLYLGSVKRHQAVDSHAEVAASPPALAPEALPEPAQDRAGSEEQPSMSNDPNGAGAKILAEEVEASPEDPEPVRAAESTVFAESLLSEQPGDASAGGSIGRTDTGAESAAETTDRDGPLVSSQPSTEAAATPAEEGAGPSVAPATPQVPTPPRSVAPAVASPLVSLPGTSRTQEAPRTAAPVGSIAQTPTAQPDLGDPTLSPRAEAGVGLQESQDAERDRVLEEYAAMRRMAEEQMYQYWHRMGVPGPAVMPYGYPAYPPGGYAPR